MEEEHFDETQVDDLCSEDDAASVHTVLEGENNGTEDDADGDVDCSLEGIKTNPAAGTTETDERRAMKGGTSDRERNTSGSSEMQSKQYGGTCGSPTRTPRGTAQAGSTSLAEEPRASIEHRSPPAASIVPRVTGGSPAVGRNNRDRVSQATEIDSPHASAGGKDGLRDLALTHTESSAALGRGHSSAVPSAQASPAPAESRRDESEDAASSLGLSQMRMASLSLGSPASEIDAAAAGRQAPSPIRRTGLGSGVFLANDVSSAIPRESGASNRPALSASATCTTLSGASVRSVPTSKSGSGASQGQSPSRDGESASDGDESSTSRSTSAGFFSSADASKKAAGAMSRSSSTLPSVPRGFLDKCLDAAAAFAAEQKDSSPGDLRRANGSPKRGQEGAEELPNAGDRKKGECSDSASVPEATRSINGVNAQRPFERPLPQRVATGPGGWIQKKGAALAKGRSGDRVTRTGEEECTASDAEDGSISQNVLAIGVPTERRVSNTACSSLTANANARDGNVRDGDRALMSGPEELEGPETCAHLTPALNTQDIDPDNFSQIRKDCSQGRREIERLLDEAIAGGESEIDPRSRTDGSISKGEPWRSSGSQNLGEGDSTGSRSPSSSSSAVGNLTPIERERVDIGFRNGERDRRKGKQKQMKVGMPIGTSMHDVRRGEGSTVERMIPVTPGACMRGSTPATSAKKTTISSPAPNTPAQQGKNVFDLPSDEEGGDDHCNFRPVSLSSPRAKRSSSKAVASPVSRKARQKPDEGKGDPSNLAHSRGSSLRADAVGAGTVPAPGHVDEANVNSDANAGFAAGDEEEGASTQDVVNTQDVIAERTMAAIRTWTPTPGSSGQEELADGASDGEDTEDEDEQGADQVPEGRKPLANESSGKSGKVDSACNGSATAEVYRAAEDPPAESRQLLSSSAPAPHERTGDLGQVSSPIPSRGEHASGLPSPTKTAPMTYAPVFSFLRDVEKWECVKGKGLYSWVYVMPGSVKGKNGREGIDFLASEEAVVEYMRCREGLLARYREHWLRRSDKAAGSISSREGSDDLILASDQVLRATEEAVPSRMIAASGVRSVENHLAADSDAATRRRPPKGMNKRSQSDQENDRRQKRQKVPAREGNEEREEHNLQQEELEDLRAHPWKELKKRGWKCQNGSGLVSHVYLKDGVSKRDGQYGVNMFHSVDEALQHELGLTTNSKSGATRGAIEKEAGVESWLLAKHKKQRSGRPKRFPDDTLPPEFPESKKKKAARSPKAKRSKRAQKGESGTRSRQERIPSAATVTTKNLGGPSPGKTRTSQGKRSRLSTPSREQPAMPAPRRGQTIARSALHARGPGGLTQEQDEDDIGGGTENDDDGVDDMEAATQPQNELSLAMNLMQAAETARSVGTATAALTPAREPRVRAASVGRTQPARATAERNVSTPESGRRGRPASPSTTAPTPSSDRSDLSPERRPQRVSVRASDAVSRRSRPSSPASRRAIYSDGGDATRGNLWAAGGTKRTSGRRFFTNVGVLITGLPRTHCDTRRTITSFGGEVVDIFDGNGVVLESAWTTWLLEATRSGGSDRRGGGGGGGGGISPLFCGGERRLIAVASPTSDRTPKFQAALAAGVPIVHPAYITACAHLGRVADVREFLLPLGRSALGDHDLVMPPSRTAACSGGGARSRPFEDKNIMYFDNEVGKAKGQRMRKWEFIYLLAGAKVTTIVDDCSGGTQCPPGLERCDTDEAVRRLGQGHVHVVIGPDGCQGPTVERLAAAALRAGTASGTVGWASQCLIHGRQLLSMAETCPWFPLGEAEGGDLDGAIAADAEAAHTPSGNKKGKRKARERGGRNQRTGRDAVALQKRIAEAAQILQVHCVDAKRYFAGDFALLEVDATSAGGITMSGSRRKSRDDFSSVVRIESFQRRGENDVVASVTVMERMEGKVLIPGAEKVVGANALGRRVLVMTRPELETTLAYSLNDETILTFANDVEE